MLSVLTNKIEQILKNKHTHSNSEDIFNELLDQSDDLIAEIKRDNPILMEFFRNNSNVVMKMVEYISLESDDLNNLNRSFKYPMIVSDIFDCSPQPIIN